MPRTYRRVTRTRCSSAQLLQSCHTLRSTTVAGGFARLRGRAKQCDTAMPRLSVMLAVHVLAPGTRRNRSCPNRTLPQRPLSAAWTRTSQFRSSIGEQRRQRAGGRGSAAAGRVERTIRRSPAITTTPVDIATATVAKASPARGRRDDRSPSGRRVNESNRHCCSDGGRKRPKIIHSGVPLPFMRRYRWSEQLLSHRPIDAPGF